VNLHADIQHLYHLQFLNQQLINQIITKFNILHEVLIDVNDLEETLNTQQIKNLVEFNKNDRSDLELHAREFEQLVNQLFVRLIQREYNDDIFNVEIISYFIICTLDHHEG
jgi:hypothetical protein